MADSVGGGFAQGLAGGIGLSAQGRAQADQKAFQQAQLNLQGDQIAAQDRREQIKMIRDDYNAIKTQLIENAKAVGPEAAAKILASPNMQAALDGIANRFAGTGVRIDAPQLLTELQSAVNLAPDPKAVGQVTAENEALKTTAVGQAQIPVKVAEQDALMPGKVREANTLAAAADAQARAGTTVLPEAEATRLGFPAGTVVQRLPNGKIEVLSQAQEATAPTTVRFPDGRMQAFRRGDPNLDAALQAGATPVSLSVQATSTEALGPTRAGADELRGDIQAVGRARQTIRGIIQSFDANPNRAGVTGTIKAAVQRGTGMLSDVAGALGVDLGGYVTQTLGDVQRDLQNGGAEQDIAKLFDPALPQNKVAENALAYALARARKGSGRLNNDDVDNARKDVALTGLTSAQEVIAKLGAVDAELGAAEKDFTSRLGGTLGELPRFKIEGGRLVPVQ